MSTNRQRLPSLLALGVHELRTPVTVAAGYLRMLLQGHGGDLSSAQRTLAEHAERSVGRIGALVAELRDVANLESGAVTFERRKLPLFRVVAEAARQTGDERIRLRGSDTDCWVQGDAGRLRTAFISLLTATLRGRSDDGRVVVDCRVRASGRKGTASIRIGDSAARTRGRTRELDEWRGGLGLTLPIARLIIEAHGGHVRSGTARVNPAITVEFPLGIAGRANRTG